MYTTEKHSKTISVNKCKLWSLPHRRTTWCFSDRASWIDYIL